MGNLAHNLRKLVPVKKGDSVRLVASSDRINAMQEAIKSLARGDNVFSGENIRKATGEGYFLLSAQPKSKGGGGTPAALYPWKTTFGNEGTADDPNYRVRVNPGSVNSLVPSNIFDIDDSAIDGGGEGLYYVKIQCDTDGFTPNDITVIVDTSPVDPSILISENTAPPTFFDTIALIKVTDDGDGNLSGQVFQVRFTNLNATPIIAFLESQTPSSPGDEPFVRYWRWSF